MLQSLSLLLKFLINKYNINYKNVLAHSDISPFRKQDPGSSFPWNYFYSKRLAYKPNIKVKYDLKKLEIWFEKNGFTTKKQISLFILNYIGYDIREVNINKLYFKKLIKAYQMRYLQKNLSEKIDTKTFNFLLKHYLSLILTKN